MRLSRRFRLVVDEPQGHDRMPVLATDRVLGGTCMVKFAPAGTSPAHDLVAEGALLNELSHPHLVQLIHRFDGILDLWDQDRVTGFATRWVDGPPINEALEGASLERKIEAMGQLLGVVHYLHRNGVLHLDIKAQNVLFGEQGTVLIDLGSARPLDSGPGEAGGTLGYAAPEVLAGQSASVAADLYSLGALFYQLISGRRPHSADSRAGLRRAVLAGDVVPIRAVVRGLPLELAQVIDSLLQREVARRPLDVPEVVARLLPIGVAPLDWSGASPFQGRKEEIGALHELMAGRPSHRLAVVGPAGMGRSRLIRRAIATMEIPEDRQGIGWLDLDSAPDPLRALDGLAWMVADELPAPAGSARWVEAVCAAFRFGEVSAAGLFFGRREEIPLDLLTSFDRISEALAVGGVPVVWAATDPIPGAATIRLGPLSDSEMAGLGRYLGVVSARRMGELGSRAGGSPGQLLRLVAPGTLSSGHVAEGADGVLALLELLPPGLPRQIHAALPQAVREAIGAHEKDGIVYWAADDRLYLDRIAEGAPAEGASVGQVASLLEAVAADVDPLWYALAAARIGRFDLATEVFESAVLGAARRGTVLMELAERLTEAGHRPALLVWARLREEEGDLEHAIRLRARLEDPSVAEQTELSRVMRRAGRFEEARAVTEAALKCESTGIERARLWLEVAYLNLATGEFADAAAACERAEQLDPSEADGVVLEARVQVALIILEHGGQVPGVEELVCRVEEDQSRKRLSSRALASAARILQEGRQLDRSERLLGVAADRADEEGDAERSAGVRLNRGSVLQGLGKGKEARRAYQAAREIAQKAGLSDILLRICYSLADLELRAGRLPVAERELAAFEAEVQHGSSPEAVIRGVELRARWLLAKGRPQEALARVEGIHSENLPANLRISCDIIAAKAHLQLGRPGAALRGLVETPPARSPAVQALVTSLRARAEIAQAREKLASARAQLPDEPDPFVRFDWGEVLLAYAGEDLDPDSFPERRQDLDRAARLLRWDQAARAATLRDRLLVGPGAALEGIVQLTEAMHDPARFPEALARLVAEALGAYRVLIMMRLPGLGKQLTYRELSGMEAAGIGAEVMNRIRDPDSVWLSDNAFDDPHLRETSRTVRTFELKSLLAVAIPHLGRAVGALYVDDLYRAGRFKQADVEVLQRLASAVGSMVPLLSTHHKTPVLEEPTELLGLLLSDTEQIAEIEYSLSMLKDESQTNLLITGPTGAGKTVLANRIAIEVLGLKGVLSVECRQMDSDRLVSTLTGVRKGDFTGAIDRSGLLRQCLEQGSALFIDEIQNLDDAGQQVLLPLLELPIRHIASLSSASEVLKRPLHVILGTNAEVSRGRWSDHFREDLWYRMSLVQIDLPPLGDRGPEAIYRYLRLMLEEQGAPLPEETLEPAALQRLTRWTWPGNLRQLQAFAQRTANRFRNVKRRIRENELERLLNEQLGSEETRASPTSSPRSFKAAQVGIVMDALERHNWVQINAARELGMTAPNLHKFLKRNGLIDEVNRQKGRGRAQAGSQAPG